MPSPHEQFTAGIRLFNRGEFFECHEALEGVWLQSTGEDRTFLQGLIQVAVSFYHLRHANYPGAGRLLRAGMEKLASPSSYRDRIDLPSLLEFLNPLLQSIETEQADPHLPAPAIRLLPAAG